jgi:hypothetical protein
MIDTSFDFTSDSPHYWDTFWENSGGLGAGGSDPDSSSRTLQRYHQILWSKELPCGETMKLSSGAGPYYLTWKDFRFGSDSIIVCFRHWKNQRLINEVSRTLPDYRAFMEDFVHRTYTIGGMIIFPKHQNSINQRKGTHPLIGDRWDLTLECIRRYYMQEDSPLKDVLETDKGFFDLFVDFKGYVDFFFLQDCVTDDYSSVNIWLGNGSFKENPFPQTIMEYLDWIEKQLTFLEKRNKRIADSIVQ